jgi:uroporphyrin-III C-methyltransferase
VILHDDLVSPPILALAKPGAEIVNVGKRCGTKTISQDEINALMIQHALLHRRVVRLKGGDPLLFGRAAEEIDALAAAGIAVEIVPGISAAFAAAAAVGCSLTDRNSASGVVFSTGHRASSPPPPSIQELTRVVYMPGRDLAQLAQEWLAEGLPPELPCILVSRAQQPEQQMQRCTLANLGSAEPLQAPSLLLAGWAFKSLLQ